MGGCGWLQSAQRVIEKVDAALPADLPLTERMAAIDAAYPFYEREHWPYKQWLKARKKYLGRFGYRGQGRAAHLSPLERMMKKAKESAHGMG